MTIQVFSKPSCVQCTATYRALDKLQEFGVVQRGRLGVTIQGLDDELADSFGLDAPKGALISSVEPDSAADKAKLKAGDVILAVNGDSIDDSADLPRVIGEMRPGTKIELEIWREKKRRTVNATLGSMGGEQRAASIDSGGGGSSGKLGLTARPLTEQEASQLEVPGGLVVERVEGTAAKAGLQRGDVILALNNDPVTDIASFRKLLKAAGDRFALLVQRGNARIYLAVRNS